MTRPISPEETVPSDEAFASRAAFVSEGYVITALIVKPRGAVKRCAEAATIEKGGLNGFRNYNKRKEVVEN